jgi:hypothetical protein
VSTLIHCQTSMTSKPRDEIFKYEPCGCMSVDIVIMVGNGLHARGMIS